MYVVVEFNQASHRPRLADDEVFDTASDAREIAGELQGGIDLIGRRERYEVFDLVEVED